MSVVKPVSCHVVVAAAGNGLRFKSQLPKQFHTVNGKPIILYTIEKFLREEFVKNIVVVAPECQELFKKMEQILHKHTKHSKNNIVLTTGRVSRHRSIFQGLKHLKCMLQLPSEMGQEWQNELVIIHDGVRPFVNNDDIARVVAAAKLHKAAGLVKPLVSTVIKLDSQDMLEESLDRAIHWSSEMPQAFHFGTIFDAYVNCSEHDLDHGTECLQVAYIYGGVHAKLLRGDPNTLWKITLKRDLASATSILSENKNTLVVHSNTGTEELKSLDFAQYKKGSVKVCVLQDLEKYMTPNITELICTIQDQSQILSMLKIIAETLQHRYQNSPGSSTTVILLLQAQCEFFGIDEKIRSEFNRITKQMSNSGAICHIIVVKSMHSKTFDMDLSNMLSCLDKLPSGQILYL